MSKTRKDRFGGITKSFMLNQHAPKFGDRRTKRNRSRSEQKRKAILEQGF